MRAPDGIRPARHHNAGAPYVMADSSNTTPLSVKDLLALATRLRDGADNMLADRALAADLRQAADLASRWANFREGWDSPDLSYAAISELSERINDCCDSGGR